MKEAPSPAIWCSIIILFLAYGDAFIDRQLLSLLVGPIRSDLQISDTQFSLLHGFAFALFYASFGIPIGRWVDKGDRPVILAIGMAVWSVFTCLCGLSRNFTELFFFRMAVGAGEATVVPISYSLIAEYFPEERRGLALGLFGSGVYFGLGGAMFVGGAMIGFFERSGSVQLPVVGILHPWQIALLALGTPGVILALLALLLPEPRRETRQLRHIFRGKLDRQRSDSSPWRYYYRAGAAIPLHHLSVAFMAMALYAMLTWAPEHFRRRFGLPPTESGPWVGAAIITGGTLGVVLGGMISDRLIKQHVTSARLLTLAIAALLATPATTLFAFAVTGPAALVGLGGCVMCVSTLTSVGAAGVQELMPSHMRGLGAAVYQLTVNLVALSLGPYVVALLTDYVFCSDQKLFASLGISLPVMLLLAMTLAIIGLRPYSIASQAARSFDDRFEI